ncbi:MAG: SRPBCC family protein, partial [Chloroflexi bacterium]|nr:SRPBCC family protein [Chloroflexota bacterium]
MTQPAPSVVRRTISVAAPRQRAFDVFTASFGAWWPRDYGIGPAPMVDFIIEPKVGGRWYELDEDGTQCDTGRVLAYEPPHRIVLAWQLNEQFQYDADPSHASEVEIRFVAESPSRTRVELEHRGLERHGAGADAVRAAMDAPNGWTAVL